MMSNGPKWFKMHGHYNDYFSQVPDEIAGAALKAALQYFVTDVEPEISDPLVLISFGVLKNTIERAWDDYNKNVEYGRRGAEARGNVTKVFTE